MTRPEAGGWFYQTRQSVTRPTISFPGLQDFVGYQLDCSQPVLILGPRLSRIKIVGHASFLVLDIKDMQLRQL